LVHARTGWKAAEPVRAVRVNKLLACVGIAAAAMGASRVAAETGGTLRRVHFLDGRTMDVAAYHVEASDAVLTLAGGVIAVPVSQVIRVENLAPPPASSTAEPAPSIPQEVGVGPGSESDSPSRPATESEAEVIDRLIREAARRYDLEVDLLSAVVAVESGRKTGAVSPKGAQGLMQLMPATAMDLAVSDPFDPAQNLDAGARYLRQLLDLHGDSYTNALAAYNAGTGRVARWKGVPPYKETQNYVHRVLQHYALPAGH
jgi:hypothetical protein